MANSTVCLSDILPGSKFHKLSIIDVYHNDGVKVAKVKCDCGNELEVRASNIASGRSKSCGCWRASRMSNLNYDRWEDDPSNDRVGEIHGWLTVIKRDYNPPNHQNIFWVCKCKCGKEISVVSYRFTRRNGVFCCRSCYPKWKENVSKSDREIQPSSKRKPK